MEYISCDFCNSRNLTLLFTKDIVHNTSSDYFQIVSCKDCGLNFTNPRPDKKIFQDIQQNTIFIE